MWSFILQRPRTSTWRMRSRVRFRIAPDLLERDAAAVGDVERAGLRHLPHLEVREVQLDGAALRVDVEVQVVRAAHERARPRHRLALLAGHRALDVLGVDEQLRQPALVAREALGRDGLRAHAPVAAAPSAPCAGCARPRAAASLPLRGSPRLPTRPPSLCVVHSFLLGRSRRSRRRL